MRKLLYLLLLLMLPCAARANQNAQGWCEVGAQPVVLSGLTSTTLVQQSFPSCTVTVFIHGGGLAAIFSDNVGTPLSNPFTASSNGRWLFYGANGRYDIQLSGAGFPSPVTYSDVSLADPANQQAALPNTNLTFSATPSFNVTNNVSYTMLLTGNVISSTTSGTPANGNLLSLTLVEDGLGSRTFVFPPNFILPLGFSFNLLPNATNALTFKFDGTNWNLISNSGAGGGSAPIGPVNSLQKNNSGIFAASNLIDNGTTTTVGDDLSFLGPNPVYDVRQYGGYLSASSPPSTTGAINATTTALTLVAAQDFANGQGIVIYGAGPATVATTPAGMAVTPVGILNGSTTWNYKVILEDYSGGLTAASAAGTTIVGAASLGVNSITMTSCARVSGLVTCTTPANHNLQAGIQINIPGGSTSNSSFEGAFTLVSTPTGTTFTYNEIGLADSTATGGSVQAVAKNLVQWVIQPYVNLRSWIYRSQGAGSFSLVGVTQGMDSSFTDWGLPAPNAPSYIPATPPVSATPQWLSTKIASGGGTTSLTLAAAATTTVAASAVLHDNTPAILAACSAIGAASGTGTILIPYTNPNQSFVINSTLNMKNGGSGCSPDISIQIGSSLVLNQTIIPGNSQNFIGLPASAGGTEPFGLGYTAPVTGKAYPMVMAIPGTSSSDTFINLFFQPSNTYQSGFWEDQDSNGNNSTNFRFDNTGFVSQSGNGGMPFKIGGGFGYYFSHPVFASGAAAWGKPESFIVMTNSGFIDLADHLQIQQLAGIMEFDNPSLANGGMLFDAGLVQVGNTVGNIIINTLVDESRFGPILRVTGSMIFGAVTINDPIDADILGGSGTPLFDIGNGQTQVVGVTISHPECGNGVAGVISTVSAAQGIRVLLNQAGGACGYLGTSAAVVGTRTGEQLQNSFIQLSGTGRVFEPMTTPAIPVSAVVSAGGAVPTSVTAYAVSAVDIDGFETLISPVIAVSVTTGNQTVTVTPPAAPSGAVGYFVYRGQPGSLVRAQIPGSCNTPIAFTSTFVDTSGSFCGNSVPSSSVAAVASIGPSLISSGTFNLIGGGFKSVNAGTFTATRTVTTPDVTGTMGIMTGSFTNGHSLAPNVSGGVLSIVDSGFPASGGAGTVTSFSAGNLSPLFTTSVSTATTTPALTFTLSNAAANTVFGNFTGGSAAPTFTAAPTFSAANLTSFPTLNQNTTGTASNLSGTPALPNGTTATTQAAASNDTKLATDAYVDGHFIANGTAAMGTSAIASGACATVVTVTATGTATTDVVSAGFNGDPTAVTGYGASATGAVLTIYPYPTTNNVNFKVCNSSAASITPSALTLNWKVTR